MTDEQKLSLEGRVCALETCKNVLVRRKTESWQQFKTRTTCSNAHRIEYGKKHHIGFFGLNRSNLF